MPSFESSELGRSGIEGLTSGRIEMLARQLEAGGQTAPPSDEKLKKVSQDFAAVFYSIAFKEMQESTHVSGEEEADAAEEEGGDEEQDSPVTQGTQDFVGMFMPQAIAGDAGDPLVRYIYDGLKQYYGGKLDAKA